MPPEERITILEKKVEDLQLRLGGFLGSDRYVVQRDMQFLDGRDIIVAKGTGTSIGSEATQKLSVYGVTPVVQASSISAPSTPSSTYIQAEAQTAVTAINSIRTAIKNFGITA